jgi:predicted metal-dependent phosphotriesterase family hydrolase
MRIVTAAGPIDPDALGTTLMHEHVTSHAPGDGDTVAAAERALAGVVRLGIDSVVDVTGRGRAGSARGVHVLEVLADRLDVNLVVGFAFYKDPYLTELDLDLELEGLVELYRCQATDGIAGSRLRAGLYGEIGTSLDEITPREEMHLRAAARAHVETGLAISTHCTLGTMALDQVAILGEEGADLSRVVLGHLDLRPEPEYLEQVLATGANIAFDTFGKEWFDYQLPGQSLKQTFHRPDTDRVRALVELISRGHSNRIVMSSDMTGLEAYFNPTTHGLHGYGYLHAVVIPQLLDAGVGHTAIDHMLVGNPARILAVP